MMLKKKTIQHRGIIVSALALAVFGSFNAQAIYKGSLKESCISELTISDSAEHWRESHLDTLMALRSNAPHYWAWSKSHASHFFTQQELSAIGTIVGDIHNRNFGFTLFEDRVSDLRVIDLDDGGVGPFILDVANYLHRVKVAAPELKTAEIFLAYVEGAMGIRYSDPQVLEEVKQLKRSELKKKKHKTISKKIIEYVDDRGEKAASFNYDKRPEFIQLGNNTEVSQDQQFILDQWKMDGSLLRSSLISDGFEIMDIAGYAKTTGGSQGVPRFVFLVKNKKKYDIITFKQFVKPATANYLAQPSHTERFKTIVKNYWPAFENDELPTMLFDGSEEVVAGAFSAITLNTGRSYLRLPKTPNFIDYDDTPDNEKELAFYKEMTLFKANFLGQRHGKQVAFKPMLNSLRDSKNRTKLLAKIKQFLAVYQKQVDKLHGK